jgi:hypothetical protein
MRRHQSQIWKRAVVCTTVVVWTLPNAAVFNKQRANFTEAPEPQEK